MSLRRKFDKFEEVFNTGIYPYLIHSVFEEDFIAGSDNLTDKDLQSIFTKKYVQQLKGTDLNFLRIEATEDHTVVRLGKTKNTGPGTKAGTTKITYAIDHRDLNVYNSEYDL